MTDWAWNIDWEWDEPRDEPPWKLLCRQCEALFDTDEGDEAAEFFLTHIPCNIHPKTERGCP